MSNLSESTYRKFTESFDVTEWEIETDSGWVDIVKSNKTVPYEVYELTTESGKTMQCADTHIVFDANMNEIYAQDTHNKYIQTRDGVERVISVVNLGYSEEMYDLEVAGEDHRYYASDILSHNSITVLSGFLLHEILFKNNQNCAVLANKGSLARDQLSKLKMSYELLPLWLQQGVVTWNKGSIELENGSQVIAAATSASSVRGNSYNAVVLDEFAHVETNLQEEFFESTYPTLSSGKTTKLIIISTPKGMNLFHKIWTEAEQGKNEFKTFRVDWWQVEGRDEKWKEETLRNIGEQRFNQEYGNEFLGSDETLISGSTLRSLVWQTPISDDGNGLRIYEQPAENRPYVITVDTAEGVGGDYHAISVFDVSSVPYKQVATYRNNTLSIYVFPTIVYNLGMKYNEAMVLVELMSTGKQIVDMLRLDLEYENILMIDSNQKKGQSIGGGFKKTSTFGLKTNKATKKIGCSNLKSLIEQTKLLVVDEHTIKELYSFVRHNDTYKAEDGRHDDMAMTLVLFAWMTAQKYFTELTDIDVRASFLNNENDAIYEDLSPVGIFIDGREVDGLTDTDGQYWQTIQM